MLLFPAVLDDVVIGGAALHVLAVVEALDDVAPVVEVVDVVEFPSAASEELSSVLFPLGEPARAFMFLA